MFVERKARVSGRDLLDLLASIRDSCRCFAQEPRSAYPVRGYMSTVLGALNWGQLQGWLPNTSKLRKIKTPKQKVMKGGPIKDAEFERMLEVTSRVVGEEAAESWKHVRRGLWSSALRVDELMHVSWDKPGTIRPVWKEGQLPILEIPAAMQKNDTEESIPLLPWFESVLLETPPEERKGWVFRPQSLQLKLGRKRRSRWNQRMNGRAVRKKAPAHDLRRSIGERRRDAGVPPLVICRVMRHSSWETTRKYYAPGDIQRDAEVLRATLKPSSDDEKETAS